VAGEAVRGELPADRLLAPRAPGRGRAAAR